MGSGKPSLIMDLDISIFYILSANHTIKVAYNTDKSRKTRIFSRVFAWNTQALYLIRLM